MAHSERPGPTPATADVLEDGLLVVAIPAQRPGPRGTAAHRVLVHGGPGQVGQAVRALAAGGWQTSAAVRGGHERWYLTLVPQTHPAEGG